MFDPHKTDVEQGVKASMDLFEKAHVGPEAPLDPIEPKHVLVVLDGSTQDGTSIGIARELKARFSCDVTVCDAREKHAESNDVAEGIAAGLGAGVLARSSGESYEQILAAIEKTGCDLCVVPCPYGRDLTAVGADSAGTVIDVLLARSPVPLIVVRKPYAIDDKPFHDVVLLLIGENEAAERAARWASGLVAASGEMELLLILEEEFYENIHKLLQVLEPNRDFSRDDLVKALEQEHVRLHHSLQKTASEKNFGYRLEAHREDEPSLAVLERDEGHPLVVVALERGDHASEGHVSDRIRKSPNPILVVFQ
ncbi:universal stress protein [Calycomorphotria hydatis]|uniref:Universal stress protein family protein n=1 Tax=Calycomorphotria hydatis TaxID=2528027 RepID=A0A517TF30_9PLAN|nr:universal stress protein [Calycomorphotria hydatis]QDT66981.1 hypothetical protein V22_42530 [Calycomorphotria hydatis]